MLSEREMWPLLLRSGLHDADWPIPANVFERAAAKGKLITHERYKLSQTLLKLGMLTYSKYRPDIEAEIEDFLSSTHGPK